MTVNNHGGSSDEYHNEGVKYNSHKGGVKFCTNTRVKRCSFCIAVGAQDLHSDQCNICNRKETCVVVF